jgi:hypothetical protein
MSEPSIVLQVSCEDDDCGMFSAFRFYKDGSYRIILNACCHTKRLPKLDKIRKQFDANRVIT